LLGTAVSFERILLEKLVTALAMPTGLIWLTLWALTGCAFAFKLRHFSYLFLGIWCGFTVITSPLTAHFFASRLERGIEDIDIDTLPDFEAIIVLGGGTTESPSGRAAVGGAGERVVLGARLFHAGKTKLLVTTGETIAALRRSVGDREERDGADQTQEIWVSLKVPEVSIQKLKGRNTREEMDAIVAWRSTIPANARIGLITSAWHLPRALRLAKKQGLEVVPLPADFIAGRAPTHFIELLPSGGSAGKLEMVLKEYLAWLVGR
jgi:uncharacterized SAM-binding protein YcdF (DUF218 family)